MINKGVKYTAREHTLEISSTNTDRKYDFEPVTLNYSGKVTFTLLIKRREIILN